MNKLVKIFITCVAIFSCSPSVTPSTTGIVEVSLATVSSNTCTLNFSILDVSSTQATLVDLNYITRDAAANQNSHQVLGSGLTAVFASTLLPANGSLDGVLAIPIDGLASPIQVDFIVNGVTLNGLRQFAGQATCED